MPLAPDDVVRISFRGFCFNQRIILDLTYLTTVGVPGQPTDTTLLSVLDAVQLAPTDIRTAYLACLPPQYELTEIRAQRVFPTRDAYVSFFPAAGTVGTNANNATVSNDAAAITRRTPLAGRNQVSTLKIGPAPDAVSVAGRLTNAYGTLLATLAGLTITTVVDAASTAQLAPVIANKDGMVGARFLRSYRVGLFSRVNRRRTVGIGE